ncbi:MAG: hypothetical protein HZB39_07750 [Planctomycetes bacterium]|nr:hypothetical protein [Planctomycetota bacterium]
MIVDLGIDAGGSKAAWLAQDDAGATLARGVAPAIQAAASEPRLVAEALAAIVAEAGAQSGAPVVALVAGIAGAGVVAVRRAVRDAYARIPGAASPMAIVGDCEVAAAACLWAGSGVALWSGTGSFCIARGKDGSLQRAGGRGLLLDDRGGAASIVLAAARLAVECDDGVHGATALTPALATAFAVSRARELGRAMRGLEPRALAERLPVVLAIAGGGDAAARGVIAAECDALASRAVAAVRRAGLAPAGCEVFLGGGALAHHDALRDALSHALRAKGFDRVPHAGGDAVLGAVRLARALRRRESPLCTWLEDDRAA